MTADEQRRLKNLELNFDALQNRLHTAEAKIKELERLAPPLAATGE
jgi:hypothetical protein